jgi:hypothetical protein
MDAEQLLDMLTNARPHREVYRAQDGGWFVTYGGGEVLEATVQQLVTDRRIVSVYSDCPNDCYHVGRTLDVARTLEERKNYRRLKDAPKIYVGDPSPPRDGGR